jgi:hypothetical protein
VTKILRNTSLAGSAVLLVRRTDRRRTCHQVAEGERVHDAAEVGQFRPPRSVDAPTAEIARHPPRLNTISPHPGSRPDTNVRSCRDASVSGSHDGRMQADVDGAGGNWLSGGGTGRSWGVGCSAGRGGVAHDRGSVLLSGMWGWADAILWHCLDVMVGRCLNVEAPRSTLAGRCCNLKWSATTGVVGRCCQNDHFKVDRTLARLECDRCRRRGRRAGRRNTLAPLAGRFANSDAASS